MGLSCAAHDRLYNFQTKMAVLNFPTRHFRIKFAALKVIWGQVKGREGSLGLVLGLVSSIEQCFRRNSILFVFFAAVFTATDAPHFLKWVSTALLPCYVILLNK